MDRTIFESILRGARQALEHVRRNVSVNQQSDPKLAKRLADLAERANEGLLTPAERREYEAHIDANNRLAIKRVGARREMSLAEFDRFLDTEGTRGPSPTGTFSRAELYNDHD